MIDDNERILNLAREVSILIEAEEQLEESGVLPQRIFEKVASLVENEKQAAIQADKDNKIVETEFDPELFLACITDRRVARMLESQSEGLWRVEGDRSDALVDCDSLPGNDMERILRYGERMVFRNMGRRAPHFGPNTLILAFVEREYSFLCL
jgi:hypothetical protein